MDKFIQSFHAAGRGLTEALIKERNFKIMSSIAAAVVFLMFYFPTTRIEKIALLITIVSVLVLELMNSALEHILDFLHPGQDPRVRVIKDFSAAVVLVACLGAAVIGLAVFWDYLF